MSALEETDINPNVRLTVKSSVKESLLSRFLGVLCSVRFGIILLILLGTACLLGMLIMQQNVDGFERYYAELTPSQRLIYGTLGLFDIYHAWYFNALLAILSTNIILASIDRFPKTKMFLSKPVLTPPVRWLRDQKQTSTLIFQGKRTDVVSKISEALKKSGWKKISVNDKNKKTFIFAQAGVWNRFGYLAVHVGLLTIFLGGFLTAQFGYTGNMPLTPGQSSNTISEIAFNLDQMQQVTKTLPFEVFCTDIQQKLIKKDGSISANNTIDWLTKVQIKDKGQTQNAVVNMNNPFDYGGYRFFQASFVAVGRARNITLRVKDENGKTQDVNIKRDGSINLADGTNIKFANFRGNFSVGEENPNEDTSDYTNPAAILQITGPNGTPETAYAFGENFADIPLAKKTVGGYTYQLVDYEKVAEQHILSVQKDPGSNVVYLGFLLLCLTLVAVFFFSHQRIWAAIEETSDNTYKVTLGGNTNRNQTSFDEKFKTFINHLQGKN